MHGCSPVWTDILEAVDFPIDIPDQHQLLSKNLYTYWLVLDLLRNACTTTEFQAAVLQEARRPVSLRLEMPSERLPTLTLARRSCLARQASIVF